MEEEHTDQPITSEDVTLVVKSKLQHPNFALELHTLNPVERKIGILCKYATLQATIRVLDERTSTIRKKQLSFLIKLVHESGPKEFLEGLKAFKRETFLYDTFTKYKQFDVDLIEFCTPNCHLSHCNRFVIVDDLLSDGFEPLDKYETLDYSDTITVIKSLARLHASSIIYEERKSEELGRKYRVSDDHKSELEEDFLNPKATTAAINCITEEIELFEHSQKLTSGQDFKLLANELSHKIFDLVKPSKVYRNVISHGALWTTNILLRGHDCKFLNFHHGRYVPPAQDLMSLIHLATARPLRKQHLYEFTGIYYATLEKLLTLVGLDLKDVVPFEDFMRSCEEQKLFGIVQAAMYLPLVLLEDDGLECLRKGDEEALLQSRSAVIARAVRTDEGYRKRLEESVQDLRDYCEYL